LSGSSVSVQEEIKLPFLHRMQEMVRSQGRRFNVVNCGRRWGKTILGLDLLYEHAFNGYPVAWFAPTYKLLLEPWTEAVSVLSPLIEKANQTDRQIILENGGKLDFWTLEDKDAGRGRMYRRAIIDEASKARYLEEAWDKAIRPTLADYKGDAWFLSTPRGRDFFWKCHTFGSDPTKPQWRSWTLPTSANPYIDPEEIEAAREQLPERVFQQEFLAEFLEDAGGVFRFVMAAVDRGRSSNELPRGGCSYTLGVDLARLEDFTVLSVLDNDGRQVYHERFNQISWERAIAAIKLVADKYRATCYVDATGVGDPIWERLRAICEVVPYHFTNASKEKLIDHLAMQIEGRKIRLMDLDVQTNELLAYEYTMTPSRNRRMNAPEGMHDDCVISLALATWGATGAGTYSFGAW
jgi:hypothetical protein